MFRLGKRVYFLIAFPILLLIGLSILIINFIPQATNPSPTSTTPTHVPLTPQGYSPPSSNPPVVYDSQSFAKLTERLEHKATLSVSDTKLRQTIITSINKQPATLYKTANIELMYIPAVDTFEGEIDSTNITLAKQDAVVWLKKQGFSQDAICNMPVIFFLNYSVAETLRGTNTLFKPMADGC